MNFPQVKYYVSVDYSKEILIDNRKDKLCINYYEIRLTIKFIVCLMSFKSTFIYFYNHRDYML